MSDNSRTFTAAMIQMRTGLMPEPSLAQATKLIRRRRPRAPTTCRRPKSAT